MILFYGSGVSAGDWWFAMFVIVLVFLGLGASAVAYFSVRARLRARKLAVDDEIRRLWGYVQSVNEDLVKLKSSVSKEE